MPHMLTNLQLFISSRETLDPLASTLHPGNCFWGERVKEADLFERPTYSLKATLSEQKQNTNTQQELRDALGNGTWHSRKFSGFF